MSETESTVDPTPTEAIDTETLFSVLGRAHTLEIIHEVLIGEQERHRFGDLQDELDLSPNTLSRRLDELVEMGFLERTQYDEIPPRVEYEATDRLAALEPTFRELSRWIDEYGTEHFCSDDPDFQEEVRSS